MAQRFFEQEFVLDEVKIFLNVTYMHWSNLLIDVTSLEDNWRHYISSGVRIMELDGTTKDGRQVSGKFMIVDNKKGILKIKSI